MKRFLIILLIMAIGLFSACNGGGDESDDGAAQTEEAVITEEAAATEDTMVTEEAAATEDTMVTEEAAATEDTMVTEEAAATEDTMVTEEAAETEDAAATEEAAVTPEPVIVSSSDDYFMAVQVLLQDNLPDGLPEAPSGERWVVVLATIGNSVGETVTVTDGNLFLIADDEEIYTAAEPDDIMQPALIGSELPAGQSVNGVVRFALPDDVTPLRLRWCLSNDCNVSLESAIP